MALSYGDSQGRSGRVLVGLEPGTCGHRSTRQIGGRGKLLQKLCSGKSYCLASLTVQLSRNRRLKTLTGHKVPSGARMQPARELMTELPPPHDSMVSESPLVCYDGCAVLSPVSSKKTFTVRAQGATTRSVPAASAPQVNFWLVLPMQTGRRKAYELTARLTSVQS